MGEAELLKCWNENPKDGLITVEVRAVLFPFTALGLTPRSVLSLPLPRQGSSHRRRSPRYGPLLRWVLAPRSTLLYPLTIAPRSRDELRF